VLQEGNAIWGLQWGAREKKLPQSKVNKYSGSWSKPQGHTMNTGSYWSQAPLPAKRTAHKALVE